MSTKFPVLIDLETRSTVDLRVTGTDRYAADPSTNLLTAAWSLDGGASYALWLPGVLSAGEIPPKNFDAVIKPEERADLRLRVFYGPRVPGELSSPQTLSRPWCGHNVWGFDRPVWSRLYPDCKPVRWWDTMQLAASIGLPQGLDAIGRAAFGEGKEQTGKSQLKKHMSAKLAADAPAVNVPVVSQLMVGKYNVQDVKLLVWLWELLAREVKLDAHEKKVLLCHDSCNSRGVRVDRGLVSALLRLCGESSAEAFKRIAALTKGDKVQLDETNLTKRNTVLAWLKEKGIRLEGDSLAKAVVAKFIDENTHDDWGDDPEASDDDGEGTDTGHANPNLPVVVEVLTLRMAALRVTAGKLNAAAFRVDPATSRIRNWSAYWAAHTGRWAGRGLQPHNMPRPKEGVDTWALIDLYERTGDLTYSAVRDLLPLGAKDAAGKPLYPRLSVDDAGSGLLRSIILPDEGDVLMAADLANIEARFLAWLADEKWLMAAFWSGSDPYLAMAERIFGPMDTWPKFPDPKKAGAFLSVKKHPYRQVGKVVVLGSGYQLGADKFAVYALANQIDLAAVGTTAPECIYAYRRMHPAIAGVESGEFEGRPYFKGGLWDKLNNAAVLACQGQPTEVGPVGFEKEGPHLVVTLPSSRRLVYRNARCQDTPVFGKWRPVVWYDSPRFGRKSMYGGSLAENIVQAGSRDVLAHGFVLNEEQGIPIVLHVHDELVASSKADRFPDFMRNTTTCPKWLTSFPLDAEGCCAPRYAKAAPPGVKETEYRNGGIKA